jgi:hypothetical protein
VHKLLQWVSEVIMARDAQIPVMMRAAVCALGIGLSIAAIVVLFGNTSSADLKLAAADHDGVNLRESCNQMESAPMSRIPGTLPKVIRDGIPPIDVDAPEKVETATFALG